MSDTKSLARKIRDKIVCHFSGHDPSLDECRKVVIPYRKQDCGFVVIELMGRIIYYGPTHCKRCGKELLGAF